MTHVRATEEVLALPACVNLTTFQLNGTKDAVRTLELLPATLRNLHLTISSRELSSRGVSSLHDIYGDHHSKGENFTRALAGYLEAGKLGNLERIDASTRAGVADAVAQELEEACAGRCSLVWTWCAFLSTQTLIFAAHHGFFQRSLPPGGYTAENGRLQCCWNEQS